MTSKEKLLMAINCYMEREFEDSLEALPEDGIIHLAYTTYDFGDGEEHEVQVDFDMNAMEYRNYIDDELALTEDRESLDEVAEEISCCGFDDIIRQVVHIGFDRFEKD